jgi:V8-like Glu-specific endopeptidase
MKALVLPLFTCYMMGCFAEELPGSAGLDEAEQTIGGTGALQVGNVGALVGISFVKTSSAYGSGTESGYSFCTGTLIAPRFVVTAKHCLPNAFNASKTNYKSFRVYFNSSPAVPNKVVDQYANGTWAFSASATPYDVVSFKEMGWDVAVLEVTPNVTSATPMSLAAQNMTAGQSITNDAYGTTDNSFGTFGTLRRFTYAVNRIVNVSVPTGDPDLPSFTLFNAAELSYPAGSASGYSCGGDSGSPVYATVGGVRKIYGVISAGSCGAGGNTAAGYAAPINSSTASQISSWMVSSPLFERLVEQLYIAYTGRPAEPAGADNLTLALLQAYAPTTVEGLVAAYSTNPGVKNIIDGFASSPESTSLYGNTDSYGLVIGVFQNVFNRPVDTTSLGIWGYKINSGATPRALAPLAILAEVIGTTSPQRFADASVVSKKTAIAYNFLTAVRSSSAAQAAYNGTAAATKARTMLQSVIAATDVNVFQSTVNTTINAIIAGQ